MGRAEATNRRAKNALNVCASAPVVRWHRGTYGVLLEVLDEQLVHWQRIGIDELLNVRYDLWARFIVQLSLYYQHFLRTSYVRFRDWSSRSFSIEG